MKTAVRVTDLVVVRGGKEVLHGVSCQVPIGSITGLLGPSGSGKTTLMRGIVGVQLLRSGQIEVFGQPAGSLQLRRQVGYVTQAPSVYADLTVRENVRYFASVAGAAAGEADRAVHDVGLAPQERQLVSTLSGGEWARASLACALVGRPRLLVLDEPTVGLDPVLREELWAMFRDLAEAGTTLIVSSHVMDEAGRCDEILLLRGGSVIAQDTPKVLLAQAGTDDLDRMFLTLIRAREAVA